MTEETERQIVNGTTYHIDTPDRVVTLLENARVNGRRYRLFYGDTDTGRSWLEEYDIIGRVGRSTGSRKIPLLINNKRSLGGPAILDDCIVAIQSTPGFFIYKHPAFSSLNGYAIHITGNGVAVYIGGAIYARFASVERARMWVEFMKGNRWRSW